MDTLQIRPATMDDAPGIAALLRELGYQVNAEEAAARFALIQHSDGELLVAVHNEADLVGCIHVFMDLRLAEGRAGEIVSLVVRSGLRGSGVGSHLVARAKAWVLARGCNRLRVRANAVRQQAHRFYQQQGFTEIKNQKVFVATLEET